MDMTWAECLALEIDGWLNEVDPDEEPEVFATMKDTFTNLINRAELVGLLSKGEANELREMFED